MKKIIQLTLLFFPHLIFAQLPINLELYKRMQEVSENEKIPVLIKGNAENVANYFSVITEYGVPQQSTNNYYRALLSPLEIEYSQNFPGIYLAGGIKGQILNDSVRILNQAVQVHQGLAGLDQAYQGEGVLVAIFDTGIDYRHPDFNDESGQTRIYRIWDQSKTGQAPEGYNYGLECDAQSIKDGSCPAFDERWPNLFGVPHGTHVSGTLAGSDHSNGQYSGMAPKATIVGVALDFDDFGTAIYDATEYVLKLGKQLDMPVVINLSAGSYNGSHDGKDFFTQATEELILGYEKGAMFVSSAGNGGRVALHLQHNATQQEQITLFSSVPNRDSFSIEFYVDSLHQETFDFQLSCVKKSDFTLEGESVWYNFLKDFDFQQDGVQTKTESIFSRSGEKLGELMLTIERYQGTYGVFINIMQSPRNSFYWAISSKGSGKMDAYSHSSLTGGSNFLGIGSIPNQFYLKDHYISPDRDQNMVGYWTTSKHFLTVGNYISKTLIKGVDGNSIQVNAEKLATNDSSSRGPTRDGRTKPDVTSTGTYVASAINLDYVNSRLQSTNPNILARVTSDKMHYYFSGTSMSSPAVAGGVALLLQRFPDLSNQDILETVRQNAYRDQYTTNSENNVYGYGKFSALANLQSPVIYGCTDSESSNYSKIATIDDGSCIYLGCTNPNAINYWAKANEDDGSCLIPDNGENYYLKIAPNPVSDHAMIYYGFKEDYSGAEINIYNQLGQLEWNATVDKQYGQIRIDRSKLSWSGKLYYVQLLRDGKLITTQKFVIQ